jgi:hypothetical protein
MEGVEVNEELVQATARGAGLRAEPHWPEGQVVGTDTTLVLVRPDGTATLLAIDLDGRLHMSEGGLNGGGWALFTTIAAAEGRLPLSVWERPPPNRFRLNLSAGVRACESAETYRELRELGLLPERAPVVEAVRGFEWPTTRWGTPNIEGDTMRFGFALDRRTVTVEAPARCPLFVIAGGEVTELAAEFLPDLLAVADVAWRCSALGSRATSGPFKILAQAVERLVLHRAMPGEVCLGLTDELRRLDAADAKPVPPLAAELAHARVLYELERWIAGVRNGARLEVEWSSIADVVGADLVHADRHCEAVVTPLGALVLDRNPDGPLRSGWLAPVRGGVLEPFPVVLSQPESLCLGMQLALLAARPEIGALRDDLGTSLAMLKARADHDVARHARTAMAACASWPRRSLTQRVRLWPPSERELVRLFRHVRERLERARG